MFKKNQTTRTNSCCFGKALLQLTFSSNLPKAVDGEKISNAKYICVADLETEVYFQQYFHLNLNFLLVTCLIDNLLPEP